MQIRHITVQNITFYSIVLALSMADTLGGKEQQPRSYRVVSISPQFSRMPDLLFVNVIDVKGLGIC